MRTSIACAARLAALGLALAAGLLPAGAAQADCTVTRLLELPVTMRADGPIAPLKINGADVRFIVDSGAFYSTIDSATAIQLKLEHRDAPFGARVQGVGGLTRPQIAKVATLDLAGVRLKDRSLLMAPAGGAESQGLLGQDILGAFDVEYDLGHGAIRLMKPTGCGSAASLAYWSGGRPVTMLDLEWPKRDFVEHTIGWAVINGARTKVIFDTGAAVSMLTMGAAARAGLKPGGEGVKPAGALFGVGGRPVRTWIARVASFTLGTEEMKNVEIRFGEAQLGDGDMLLGSDFFLSHRIYVANSQHKLYLTYEGGPLFGRPVQALTRDTPQGATKPLALADEAGAEAAPTDAEGFARRGSAFAAKHDFPHALEDLTKAVELAPSEPRYLFERARLRAGNRQPALAMADLDQALKLKPDLPDALILRAQLRLGEHDQAGAAADVAAASQLTARQAQEHLMFGDLDRQAGRPDAAVSEYAAWIDAHPDDARMALALLGRCQARVQLGQALDKAVDDCNRSFRLAPTGGALETRALAHFKSGAYDDAIRDCDAVLAKAPKQPLALYLRGAAELKKGLDQEGKADQAAAVAQQPNVAGLAKAMGLAGAS